VESCEVLVVDDETGMRLAVARVLNRHVGRRIGGARGGIRGRDGRNRRGRLEMMAASVPDICWLDMKLPGMSGLDVLRESPRRRHERSRDDHGLRDPRDGHRGDQARRPRLSAEAVHTGRPPSWPSGEWSATCGPARARRLAEEKRQVRFPVHLGARARAEGSLAAVKAICRS